MPIPRRTGFLPALALCLAALTLGACGVKGSLEAPPAAQSAAPEAVARGETADPSRKVFTAQSRVENVGTPDIIPRLPPKEWTKDKSATEAKSQTPEQRAKAVAPDKPFILDWLL